MVLGEVAAHLHALEVRCGRCERHGRLRLDRLMAQHGPTSVRGATPPLLVYSCPLELRRNSRGKGPLPCSGFRYHLPGGDERVDCSQDIRSDQDAV
jgi:hypothetical protein